MTNEDLDALEALNSAASAAPWHVLFGNDAACMSAVLVVRNPSSGRTYYAGDGSWDDRDVVAACLLQSSATVAVDDGRWGQNATLIATLRNALPDLLRLARAGIAAEQNRPAG